MTIRQAERINGLRYQVTPQATGHVLVEAFEADVLLASASNRKLKEAVKVVVEQVYRTWSREVMEAQEWRCLLCGERRPLEIDHHPVSRARGGRLDVRTNLRALCRPCHAPKHGG